MTDAVNHPSHYNSHPAGIECITVVEHMGFNLGNAIKYLWRADEKGAAIEDLRKARWYVDREIARREAGVSADPARVRAAGNCEETRPSVAAVPVTPETGGDAHLFTPWPHDPARCCIIVGPSSVTDRCDKGPHQHGSGAS